MYSKRCVFPTPEQPSIQTVVGVPWFICWVTFSIIVQASLRSKNFCTQGSPKLLRLIKMILTHYFPNIYQGEAISRSKLLTSITEYTVQEQQVLVAQLLQSSGRALHRFKQFNNYMQRRIQTERWLYTAFEKMSGNTVTRHPFYFILGKNERLKHDFGPNAGELVLDTNLINTLDISFTLGDSIGLFFSTAPKRVYSLEEIEEISCDTAFVHSQMEPLEPYHHYIEAQLWNKYYLNSAKIIMYYPKSFSNYYTTVILQNLPLFLFFWKLIKECDIFMIYRSRYFGFPTLART